jgi:hypothetical protein
MKEGVSTRRAMNERYERFPVTHRSLEQSVRISIIETPALNDVQLLKAIP